jgi:hypothetical protein
LTAIASADGRSPPNTCYVTTHLLELYKECMAGRGYWMEAHGGIEKLAFIGKTSTTPPDAATQLYQSDNDQPARVSERMTGGGRKPRREEGSLPPTTATAGEQAATVSAPYIMMVSNSTAPAHTVNAFPTAGPHH